MSTSGHFVFLNFGGNNPFNQNFRKHEIGIKNSERILQQPRMNF
ncbi:hypothetical protein ADIS_3515 [Lunatimonas lonarensis]|uniref:Uncharacterized protein n=1 Tax=Lunatimonas lonarensis TaxID=1232681 RepID=R7ZPM5_9BACT|nr:hypothetical protein ADIS_3515 [Lunatimonas lonarensis]